MCCCDFGHQAEHCRFGDTLGSLGHWFPRSSTVWAEHWTEVGAPHPPCSGTRRERVYSFGEIPLGLTHKCHVQGASNARDTQSHPLIPSAHLRWSKVSPCVSVSPCAIVPRSHCHPSPHKALVSRQHLPSTLPSSDPSSEQSLPRQVTGGTLSCWEPTVPWGALPLTTLGGLGREPLPLL